MSLETMEAEYEMAQLKCAVERSWHKLSNLAAAHRGESTYFNKLCEKYYGVSQSDLPAIVDDDRIADTIDYGIDALSFTDFDLLMVAAIKDRGTGRDDAVWDVRGEIGLRTADQQNKKEVI